MTKKKIKIVKTYKLQKKHKKNVTIVLPLKEIIYHYSRGNVSNNFNIAK